MGEEEHSGHLRMIVLNYINVSPFMTTSKDIGGELRKCFTTGDIMFISMEVPVTTEVK